MTAIAAATLIQANAPLALAAIDLFDEFATDAALETGGALVAYKGDVKFLIAREQNENFGAAITKALEDNRDAIEGDSPEAKALSEKLLLDVMARTILVGWEGNVTYQKQPLPYTTDNAIKLLGMSDFRAWVRRQAANREHYKVKVQAEAVKN